MGIHPWGYVKIIRIRIHNCGYHCCCLGITWAHGSSASLNLKVKKISKNLNNKVKERFIVLLTLAFVLKIKSQAVKITKEPLKKYKSGEKMSLLWGKINII
jgi:hypothetical protein